MELLEEEIAEESLVLSEVYIIKEILAKPGESTNLIFESLRRLDFMQLSVEILKATEVGKLVNSLRRHNSKEIRSLAKKLISSWKNQVDVWINNVDKNAITIIAGNSPNGDSPADMNNENGLLSPPLDKDAFLPIQDISKDIGQFFDGIDDEEFSLQQGTNALKKRSKPCTSSFNEAMKLEATRKRLQEGYRQAEHVKRK
eukprot:Gb_29398 [translate_table: standard]